MTHFVINTGRTGFVTHFLWHIFLISWHLWHINSAFFSPNLLNLYLNFFVSRGPTLPRDTFGLVTTLLDRIFMIYFVFKQVGLVLWHIFRDTFSQFCDIYDTKISSYTPIFWSKIVKFVLIWVIFSFLGYILVMKLVVSILCPVFRIRCSNEF